MSLQDCRHDEAQVELSHDDKLARMVELYMKVIVNRPLGVYGDVVQEELDEHYRLKEELGF